MIRILLMFALASFSLVAWSEPHDEKKHIEMHEQMAQAHSAAADCLKAGTAKEACKKTFKESTSKLGCGMCAEGHGDGEMCSSEVCPHKGKHKKHDKKKM